METKLTPSVIKSAKGLRSMVAAIATTVLKNKFAPMVRFVPNKEFIKK